MDRVLFGGIEAGGTKFVCAVAAGPDDIRAEERFPTTTPEETIGRALAFFERTGLPLVSVGIASFGPIDPDPGSKTYGFITSTPKPGWAWTDLAGAVARGLAAPVGFDTDVNAAALGEHRWGAATDVDTFVYLTVGTGIGGGLMVNGKLVHGLLHPEMGHVRIPHDRAQDPYPGHCPFHGDCLEGLAAGPALEARWEVDPRTLPADHEAWALEAHYLAAGIVNFVCTVSPRRIVLGGGVMEQRQLFPLIRAEVQRLLNGYVAVPAVLDDIDTFVVPPGLGNRAGVLGAIALAQAAVEPAR